ncbi:hypothetical protein T484DRAFT_1757304, partial [Baffinella frigidus]
METMSMDDNDTTSVEMEEDDTTSVEMEEDCCEDDTKKEKKKYVYPKCECTWSGCDMSYRKPGELKAHREFIHEKIYRNVCDHIDDVTRIKCEYKCEQRNTLTKHKQIHDNNHLYKCEECTAVCNTASGLWKHKKSCDDK